MNKLVLTLAIGALFCMNGVFAASDGKPKPTGKAGDVLGVNDNNKDVEDKVKKNKERLAKKEAEAKEKAAKAASEKNTSAPIKMN